MPLIGVEKETTLDKKAIAFEKKMLIKKISDMDSLPVPNDHIMKLMLLIRAPDADMDQIIALIEHDQALVGDALKLINSGYYGMTKTIDSIRAAVALLGLLNIKKLVYSATIMGMFSEDEKNEWNHSFASSTLIQSIIDSENIATECDLSLAMLLHDIGKVALRRFSPKKYQLAIYHSYNDKISIHRTETRMMHLNHTDISEMLLKKWNMSESMIYLVVNHHIENIPEELKKEIALMQYANWIDCSLRGFIVNPPSEELMEEAGLTSLLEDKAKWSEFQTAWIIENESADVINPLEEDIVINTDTKKMKRVDYDPAQKTTNLEDTDTKTLKKVTVDDTASIRLKMRERILNKRQEETGSFKAPSSYKEQMKNASKTALQSFASGELKKETGSKKRLEIMIDKEKEDFMKRTGRDEKN